MQMIFNQALESTITSPHGCKSFYRKQRNISGQTISNFVLQKQDDLPTQVRERKFHQAKESAGS
jgi:hypothetical protein